MSFLQTCFPVRLFVKSHHLGGAEAGHLNASAVMAVEVKTVERDKQPQVDTRDPHQHCVLETLGQVWVGCVPRTVPVLQHRERKDFRCQTEFKLCGYIQQRI